jgi:glycosyltransferase involved in cell wall biosynthesis
MAHADAVLVTTPDMKDFIPQAEHFPFFAPEHLPEITSGRDEGSDGPRPFRIVHATNHPGIEGTEEIRKSVNRLRSRGYTIDFRFLTKVPPERVLEELAEADLSIGKMKMGYYANAQIESMALGVPAVTYVRPEFMTEDLRRSGLIFSTLDKLEETIAFYLDNPKALEAKKRTARSSILRLHDNDALARRMMELYRSLLDQNRAS